MDITVWNRRDVSPFDIWPIRQAVEEFLSYLDSNGVIDGYAARVPQQTLYERYHDKEYCDSGAGTDECDIESNSESSPCDESWLMNAVEALKTDKANDPSGGDQIGDNVLTADVHLFVTSTSDFANVVGTDKDRHAYEHGPAFAYVGTEGGYGEYANDGDLERIKNAAIQEIGHALMNPILVPEIDGIANRHEEHALGKIRSDGSATPMMTFYEGDDTYPCGDEANLAGKGECSKSRYDSWDGTQSQQISDCTLEVMKQTWNPD
ncbi:hypothetical protein C475_07355 [Halosimplex carlsbadense 2-9-1]|uniref:Uncharacterized protein n=2 Tax=Halosimplex carlsbadense TaxID=171164 RepID=M0D0N6_9EURY|nr:hypothetical protein C475_07355 [Halosimplex carlsbadense 2-9-1]